MDSSFYDRFYSQMTKGTFIGMARVNNYAFRDYFQGAIKTNDIYVGNVIVAKTRSGNTEAVIAVPVYSLKDNSTIVGVWGGSIDFRILNKELQSLKIPSGAKGLFTQVIKDRK